MADAETTCAVCGVQFPTQGGKKYCCRACRERRPRIRTPKKPLVEARMCLVCDKPFHPKAKDRTKVCGRQCGLAFTGIKSKLKVTGGRVCIRTLRNKCLMCGCRFTPRSGAKYCSRQCGDAFLASRYSRLKPAAKCCVCGVSFAPTSNGGRPSTACSQACLEESKRRRRRIARGRRKATLRAASVESVDPIRVLERDAWRCRICGVRTPRRLRGTWNNHAPELDHIVPLARGGDHSYRNTQCLCRSCNIAKADGAGGQLLLFG